jgi:hypothetical protein
MALKFKTKTKPVEQEEKTEIVTTATEVAVDIIAKEVDTYADIETKIKALQDKLKPLLVKLTASKNKIMGIVTEDLDLTKDEKLELVSDSGKNVLNVGAMGKSRSIKDTGQLIDMFEEVKEGLALELAGFTLKDVDSYLTPEQQKVILVEEQKGARSFKVK